MKLHCLSPLRITSLITSNLSSHGFHRSRARENDRAAVAVVVDVVDVVVIVVVDDNDDDDVVVAVVMVVRYAIQVFLAAFGRLLELNLRAPQGMYGPHRHALEVGRVEPHSQARSLLVPGDG